MYSTHVQNNKEGMMPTETTYTSARANLASLCNDVATTRDVVIIKRRGAEDVALVAAAELRSLMETAHLLRSPKNAERILRAMRRARSRTVKPSMVAYLRKDIGLDR
jgi:antitoxin YefM